MTKVSVIVPVYNVSLYLRECLDSIINQTLQDIEIICINDGSTDNSLEILNEYAKQDNRIKIFSQKNQGPSVARNLGIEKAKGEYITFVDSDDYIDIEMCEDLYNSAKEQNTEVVLFSYYYFSDNTKTVNSNLNIVKNIVSKNRFNFDEAYYPLLLNGSWATAGKLYKKSFILENNIRFNPKIAVGDDRYFYFCVCINNPTFYLLEKYLYYYRKNTQNSVSKRVGAINELYLLFQDLLEKLAQTKYLNNYNVKFVFLENSIANMLSYINSCYNIQDKKENAQVLKKVLVSYKEIPNKILSKAKYYQMAKRLITELKWIYIKKLLEPLIELEIRTTRFVVYLFKKQIINIPIVSIKYYYYEIFYFLLLNKLRFLKNFRKIRVAFWVIELEKWTCQNTYNCIKNNKNFEPFILLSHFKNPRQGMIAKDYYDSAKNALECLGNKVYSTFNPDLYEFESLDKFKPDIIFYQQPWQIPENQIVALNYQKALLCYIPYCFYSGNSYVNYLSKFHGAMWKYFVETECHKKNYEKIFGANNCVPVGSVKLDNYYDVDIKKAQQCWKYKDKKRIIYAPHHSFNDDIHDVATFTKNGKFILELAKKHPETEWIFRPHPAFVDRLLRNSIMTKEEIENYYKEWEQIGSISKGNNYYEMFSSSDCLITDCISFLSEYAPTLKPVLHLRKDNQRNFFNEFVSKIDNSYYQIYDNEELEKVFNDVIINNNDVLAPKRIENKKILNLENLASENIFNYLKRELWIK